MSTQSHQSRKIASMHLGAILENMQPVKNNLEINEASIGFVLDYTKAILESSLDSNNSNPSTKVIDAIDSADKANGKLRSAEVPESRVGYKEPFEASSNPEDEIYSKLDDNGEYTGVGKDTYYKLDKGDNSSLNDPQNRTGSKQEWIESKDGKEASGIGKSGITESGMEAEDLPDYEKMTKEGGETSTPDEPEEQEQEQQQPQENDSKKTSAQDVLKGILSKK